MNRTLLVLATLLFSNVALAQVCPSITPGNYTCTGQNSGRSFNAKFSRVITQGMNGMHLAIPGLPLEAFPCLTTTQPQLNEVCGISQRNMSVTEDRDCRFKLGMIAILVRTTSKSSVDSFESESVMTPKNLQNNTLGASETMKVVLEKTDENSFNMNVTTQTVQSGRQVIVVNCEK